MWTRNRMFDLAVAVALMLSLPAAWASAVPEGFVPPPIHPGGATLEPVRLGPGVYALISDRPPVDNSGFVVGEKGVLVIDSHINGEMARRIQAAVRKVTKKPILYLVNTNYHGDHTFGNHAFPPETIIVAHEKTADRMRDFESERGLMLYVLGNDETVLEGVRPRLPDLVFRDRLELDLGGRTVELHHFGHGNTPGDTVVYVPEVRAAWAGNLLLGAGSIPYLIEGGAAEYLGTIGRFARTLDVETLIPGHGAPSSSALLGSYLGYLSDLLGTVRRAAREGWTLERTLEASALGLQPSETTPADVVRLIEGFHRWNVRTTFREWTGS